MANYEGLTHAVQERLEFIEIQLIFKGWVSRADLIQQFGIAEAAATRDFKTYKDIAPNNMYLNHTVKRYEINEGLFVPVFDKTPTTYINELKNNDFKLSGEHKLIEPMQRLSNLRMDTFSSISKAISNQFPIVIEYRSIENDLSKRVIIPHSFFDTDVRMYVRAYDRKSNEFRDFMVNRIIDVKPVSDVEMKVKEEESLLFDEQWNSFVELVIIPHPNSENIKNKACIEMDLDMKDGMRVVVVRKRLAPYWLNRWDVDCSVSGVLKGHQYQLYLSNNHALKDVSNAYLAPGYKAI